MNYAMYVVKDAGRAVGVVSAIGPGLGVRTTIVQLNQAIDRRAAAAFLCAPGVLGRHAVIAKPNQLGQRWTLITS